MSTTISNKVPVYSDGSQRRFIIKFIAAYYIPSFDFTSKSDPYLKAFISEPSMGYEEKKKLHRVSPIVETPKRFDCNSVIWNCYRDMQCYPKHAEAVLTVEIFSFNGGTDQNPDTFLGKVDIPIATELCTETVKEFKFTANVGHFSFSKNRPCHFRPFIGWDIQYCLIRTPEFVRFSCLM